MRHTVERSSTVNIWYCSYTCTSQWNGLSPVCDLKCSFNFYAFVNLFSHPSTGHVCGLSPLWIFMWAVRSHWQRTPYRSPPFHIYMACYLFDVFFHELLACVLWEMSCRSLRTCTCGCLFCSGLWHGSSSCKRWWNTCHILHGCTVK